jgi:hypothetical protein
MPWVSSISYKMVQQALHSSCSTWPKTRKSPKVDLSLLSLADRLDFWIGKMLSSGGEEAVATGRSMLLTAVGDDGGVD